MNKGENYTLFLPQQYKISFSYKENVGEIFNRPCKFSISFMICSTLKLPKNDIRKLLRKKIATYNYCKKNYAFSITFLLAVKMDKIDSEIN